VSVGVDVSRDLAVPGDRGRQWHVGFDDFYRAELPGLLTLARALAGPTAADDVAQEAMLATYRRWEEVRRLQDPAQWARRTCANLAVSSFRRRMVELRGLARLAGRREVAVVDETSEEFWAAVRGLPRRQAQCAALRYVYAMTGADIAGTLGIGEGSVKVHLARARRALAAALDLGAGDEQEEES
jgi:RNA polymerase sigma-70 factor (ECF subfamily)